ncbi:hydrogenase expression/formation protein HypE [Candidatus Atribacteria bacterium 1244-E10-H5-B2]|nr:MAG: hydrogenase expression/formation protein HypE [Candidatus Atribacteria bacterium 1244-E10-H5-B2]
MMKEDRVLLSHGSGGKLSFNLIKKLFLSNFNNPYLERLDDGAVLNIEGLKLAYTTDSYTVDPLFFKGGNIGELAVYGTVNDLAMCGATPLYLSCSFIIEEGFSLSLLEKIVLSMREASVVARVDIVTGDTKVVNRGAADKIFINTSGVGMVKEGVNISGSNAKVGDVVMINGPIGSHEIAVLSEREGFKFETDIKSDTAPLSSLVADMLRVNKDIHTLRDPTRGGLSTTLNEIALSSNVDIEINEDDIPIQEEVRAACEILGYDPLYLANEGKLVAFIPWEIASDMLKKMKKNKYGKESKIIGRVVKKSEGKVYLNTTIGGKRIVDMLTGEQLPRIC